MQKISAVDGKPQSNAKQALADSVGVTRQSSTAIERDRYGAFLELAFKLATHPECHIEDLFAPETTE